MKTETQSKIAEFHSEPEQSDLLPWLRLYFDDRHGEILNDGFHCETPQYGVNAVHQFRIEKRDIGTSEEYIIWELFV